MQVKNHWLNILKNLLTHIDFLSWMAIYFGIHTIDILLLYLTGGMLITKNICENWTNTYKISKDYSMLVFNFCLHAQRVHYRISLNWQLRENAVEMSDNVKEIVEDFIQEIKYLVK